MSVVKTNCTASTKGSLRWEPLLITPCSVFELDVLLRVYWLLI